MTGITRRQFIQSVSAGAATATIIKPRAAHAGKSGHLPGSYVDYIVPTMCEMCVWRCGVRAKIVDGVVEKLDGNPDHPHSGGYLCARGQSGLMTTYDPDRVLQPLMRVGERGSGRFRTASWDEALDFVADKMRLIKDNYGAEAMVFSSTHNLSQPLFENLLYGYGSPNYGTQRSLCFNAMITAHLMTYGIQEPGRRYDNKDYMIFPGRNIFGAISVSESRAVMERIANGAKLVYIDPRFSETAAKSSEWIPIKPGTDLAFYLAILQVMIADQLYDQWFVENHTIGFEELAAGMTDYTPQWAEKITGISAETIDRIAHELGDHRGRAFIHPGWRTSNFLNSFQTERCIAIINALLGLCPQSGDCMFANEASVAFGSPPQPAYPPLTAARLDGVPWKYPLVPLKLGVFQEIRDAILRDDPYPAKGWFIARQNPIMSIPETQRTIEAFKKLDLIVAVDVIMNDTAWYADVILPEASYLERYDPLLAVGNRVFIRQPVIEPQGEAKSALWIYKQLGERLGLGDYFQYEDEEDYIRQQLAPWTEKLGVTLDYLKQVGYFEVPEEPKDKYHYNTPSGKIEIASDTLRNAGFSAVPTWEAPLEPPQDQFYLLTGKVAQHTQFGTQNNPYLHQVAPKNSLWIHPDSAAQRDIFSGDLVRVTSYKEGEKVGEVEIDAWVTPGIRPDCVYLTPGFGHKSRGLRKAYDQGAAASDLHITYTDPVSGSQALTQTFVTVEKV